MRFPSMQLLHLSLYLYLYCLLSPLWTPTPQFTNSATHVVVIAMAMAVVSLPNFSLSVRFPLSFLSRCPSYDRVQPSCSC